MEREKRNVYFRGLRKGRPGLMDFYSILIPAQPNIVVSSSTFHLRTLLLLMEFFCFLDGQGGRK